MYSVMNDPHAYLDVSGRTLMRRTNFNLALGIIGVAILAAILVLEAINNRADARITDAVAAAQAQYGSLQSAIAGSPVAAASVSSQSFFQCPKGAVVQQKWIILGSAYAHGNGTGGASWYAQMLVFAGPSREVLIPPGTTIAEQLIWLGNSTKLAQWVSSGFPLLVFVEQGYIEMLAAMGMQLGQVTSDARAAIPPELAANDYAILTAPWWRGATNRIVFLVPTLPYAPQLGGFVPVDIQNCTDPLAASLYNTPYSFVTMQALSQLTNAVSMLHALVAIATQNSPSPLRAAVQIVTTDNLFSMFGFNTAATTGDIAFDSSCLYLNQAGQRLLAQYLWSCLHGSSFKIPPSLMDT